MHAVVYRFRETDALWLSGELTEILDGGFKGMLEGVPLDQRWMALIISELARQYGPHITFSLSSAGVLVSDHQPP